jgi:hypothetical protein
MPEVVVREELENQGIRVQGVLQLRSGLREQETSNARQLTPHFIVSVAKGPDVAKVRSLTELCGLRVSVEIYIAPKDPLQCKRVFNASAIRSGIVAMHTGALLVVRLTPPGSEVPRSSSLSAAAVEGTKQPTTEAVEMERDQGGAGKADTYRQ